MTRMTIPDGMVAQFRHYRLDAQSQRFSINSKSRKTHEFNIKDTDERVGRWISRYGLTIASQGCSYAQEEQEEAIWPIPRRYEQQRTCKMVAIITFQERFQIPS